MSWLMPAVFWSETKRAASGARVGPDGIWVGPKGPRVWKFVVEADPMPFQIRSTLPLGRGHFS